MVAQNDKFAVMVNADESDAGGSSGMSSLSAYFDSIVPDVDDSGQSEEEGVDMEGEGAGEGENEDASSSGGDRASG